MDDTILIRSQLQELALILDGCKLVEINDQQAKWLERKVGKVPSSLKKTLCTNWPDADLLVGPYFLKPLGSLIVCDGMDKFIQNSFFPLGYAGNGDHLVVRIGKESEEIGLISHEEIDSFDNSMEAIYQPVAACFSDLLSKAISNPEKLPLDYYHAKST